MEHRSPWIEERLPRWIEQAERVLSRRLGAGETARDLAYEAGTRLLLQIRSGRIPPAPRAWLFRTAHHLAVDEVRRRLPLPLGLELHGLRAAEDGESGVAWRVGEDLVEREDLLLWLPWALDCLPAHYRRLIDLHYRAGFDCEALARHEEISVANAKVRLHRARRRLQHLLLGAVLHGRRPETETA